MRKFFAGKFAFIAVFFLFAFAFTWNLVHGAGAIAAPDATLLAHSPSIPPNPWDDVRIAHSPSIPPDPWDDVRVTA